MRGIDWDGVVWGRVGVEGVVGGILGVDGCVMIGMLEEFGEVEDGMEVVGVIGDGVV